MKKAIWNGVVIAESDQTVEVEGNQYFPPSSIKKEYFTSTDSKSTCPWKGVASYYSINVNGETNTNAAWTYKRPSEMASEIKDHIAFWKGVEVK
ncbi:DUF427 domain-containing protein [Flammeovirga agarivorans]|uniref:DUF427 domain-containing protein n=1 Tax=Flammeovirga agarivorans TaxID=2726742 RepID=A0A7X8SJZ2_9BACT|nr:DUF427 domain-containing protein [Flammeovirga agarivorans]NLR91633.1 DUF427 domain-containing protein [Flammeovirga agarivorans]